MPYVKIGIASGPRRLERHRGRRWTLLHEFTGIEHRQAASLERNALRVLREYGFGPLPKAAVPSGDGYTECFHRDGMAIVLDVLERGGLTISDALRESLCDVDLRSAQIPA